MSISNVLDGLLEVGNFHGEVTKADSKTTPIETPKYERKETLLSLLANVRGLIETCKEYDNSLRLQQYHFRIMNHGKEIGVFTRRDISSETSKLGASIVDYINQRAR